MDATEYETYRAETEQDPEMQMVCIDEVPGEDRTLVYGYSRTYDEQNNESTHTVHVYKREGNLHVVFYDRDGKSIWFQRGANLPLADCKPTKRAYPERCDLAFARLMRAKGLPLTFTTMGGAGANSEGQFAGRFIEDTH